MVGFDQFFLTFENSFPWAFRWNITPPYLMTIDFWLFWDRSGIGCGAGRLIFFWSKNTFLRVSNYCVQCEGICLNILAKNVQQMNKWMDTFEILVQLRLRLVTCSLHWTRIQSSVLLVQHVLKNCWLLKIVIWNIFRFRVILAPFLAPDFWVSQEVTGTGQNFGSGWNWSKF